MKMRRPTPRQQRAAFALAKGHTAKEALAMAGYKSKSTSGITKTPTFQLLVSSFLPDELLLDTHVKGLSATKREATKVKGETKYERVPDHETRHKYLETAYKVKGVMRPAESPMTNVMVVNLSETLAKKYGIDAEPIATTTTDALTNADSAPQAIEAREI